MIVAAPHAPARADGARAALRRIPAWVLIVPLAAVYVILAPPSPDLATAEYRSHLFAAHGLMLWDNSWYGGHHLLAYSLLAPALGAALGSQLLAALSLTAASALFAALIAGHFPSRAARLAAAWFALGAAIGLLSSRIAFDLGVPLALGALLAAQRGRFALALVLAVCSSLASPVAGAFAALALLAWALAGPRRGWPLGLAAAALAPIGLLALAFPEGGTQPFVASAFYPALAGVLLVGALLGRERRTLRAGVVLYALAMCGSYLIATAVGGNVDRLGAMLGGPLAACALGAAPLRSRRGLLLVALAPALLYWQANAPVTDFLAAADDPSVHESYYRPLLAELHALGVGYGARPTRVEVVATAVHWEARWVAPQAMLARGWERQLDLQRNGIFYGSRPLTASTYRAWLGEQAVAYVALPDAPRDYSAGAEARLLSATGGPPPYLREIWRSRHWRLFAVLGATALAQPPAQLTGAAQESFTLRAPAAGAWVVRLHYSPYWALVRGHGCVSRARGDWTLVRTRAAATVRVAISFSLARVLERGPRCA